MVKEGVEHLVNMKICKSLVKRLIVNMILRVKENLPDKSVVNKIVVKVVEM